MPSVNEATDSTIAPSSSMAELGNVLPWIIYPIGTAPEAKGPIMFSKLDIKDGYWRMVMPEEARGMELHLHLAQSRSPGNQQCW